MAIIWNGAVSDFKTIYLARRNPSVRIEEWPNVWRSHAAFARQFSVTGARIKGLFYCSRVAEPTLDGAPFEPPGGSRDYDGVAIIVRPSANSRHIAIAPEIRAQIDQDELRVFSAYTRNSTFHCEETLVHGGPPGQAAVIRFLARRTDSAPSAFHAHWSQHHADIATRAADRSAAVTRYVHDRLIEEPPPGYPFDGITETWFASAGDAARSFVDAALAPVTDDLAKFCDPDRSITLLTGVINRWPRA